MGTRRLKMVLSNECQEFDSPLHEHSSATLRLLKRKNGPTMSTIRGAADEGTAFVPPLVVVGFLPPLRLETEPDAGGCQVVGRVVEANRPGRGGDMACINGRPEGLIG